MRALLLVPFEMEGVVIVVKKSKLPDSSSKNPAVKKGIKGFIKGKSGNPSGRTRGSRNKTTLMAQALFDGQAEQICQKVIGLAVKDGNWSALKACLDRLLPPLKSAPVVFEMPEVETVKDLVSAYRAVVAAYSSGEITADDARVIHDLLKGQRRAMVSAELAERVARLEMMMEDQ